MNLPSFNLDTTRFKQFVPLDLLGNNAITFHAQGSNINSGMAGLRINKISSLHPYPHGFMFSVDNNTKWDLGMDYENEDFVLAYNHHSSHLGDFIRIAENNRTYFGTGIGTPKFNQYKYTFLTGSTDSVGLGGVKIQTLSNLDTALNTNGVIAGSRAIFTSHLSSYDYIQAGTDLGKARIKTYYNNNNIAQFVNSEQANSSTNYGYMQKADGELFIGGTNLNINAFTNFSKDLKLNGLRVLTTIDSSKFELKTVQLNNVNSINYILSLQDAANMVNITNSSNSIITIPTNVSVDFPIGTKILITQMGIGKVTIATSGGVVLNSAAGANKTKTQYSVATLIKTDTDTWLLFGDIEL